MKLNTFKLNVFTLGLLLAGLTNAAETTLVSEVNGKSILGTSNQPSISHDGQYVTFTSNSGALVGDSSNLQHIYVKNLSNNSIQRASIASDGTKADSISFSPKISGDGKFIVYYSYAKNLVGNDNNNVTDIYRYDVKNKTTKLVSSNSNGLIANAESSDAATNIDGRYIAFSSLANNLVSNNTYNKRNVFVKDMQTGNIDIISINSNGTVGDGDSFLPAISGDGRFVVFSSIANNLDNYAANNQYDIYLHDRQNKTTERIDFSYNGGLSNGHSGQVSISNDGNVIAYISLSTNIVKNDNNGNIDVFLYDRLNNKTTRISSTLGEPNGPSFYPQVSGNGRFISLYSGATNLVSSDTNDRDDLFVYDRILGTITLASLDNNGNQISNNIGNTISINYDGIYNVFTTSDSLSSQDTNNQIDVYLRRINPPPNSKPVANVATIPSQVCVNGGSTVTLDASGSSDIDNDELTYTWSGNFGTVTGEIVNVFLGPGQHDINLTVTDSKGDQNNQSFSVNITDSTAPTITAVSTATLEATSINGALYTLNYSAADNCQIASISEAPTLTTYPLGSTDVTITVRDSLGNTATDQTRVTVQDTIAPVISIPANINKEANAIKTKVDLGSATASDIFPTTISNNAPNDYPLGNTQVTWTASDSNGNASSNKQLVTIKDTTAPSLTAPGDKFVEATAPEMSVSIGNAIANDIFLADVTHNAPTLFPMGSTQVTWTASDTSGNKTNAVQNIQVMDTTAPELLSDSHITLEASSIKGAQYNIQYSSKDNCVLCGPIKITFDPNLDYYPLGDTTVQLTASDSSNNLTSNNVYIKVQDTTPPVLTIPNNIESEATAINSVIDINEATASDIFPVDIKNDAPYSYPLGNTTVVWTATDSNGNITSKNQKITVTDNTAPLISAPIDIEIEANAILSAVDIGLADATDIFGVTITNDAPTNFSLGKTTVIWKATDANGLTSTATQQVAVIDTTAPVLTIPSNLTIEAQARLTTVDIGQASAKDIFRFEISNNAPASYALGDTIVTWTVIDANGNKSTATQIITIVDTTPPTISAGSDIVLEAVSTAGSPFTLSYLTSDICDCGDIVINITPLQANYALGETEITVTATDISGNKASDTMKLTVVDTTKPTLQVPTNIIQEATGPLTPVFLGNATSSDIFNVSVEHNAPPIFPLGSNVVTWTATDENGNSTTAQQMVAIIDTTPPVFQLDMEKEILWPANHKMRYVGSVEKINDLVDSNPVVNIEITSNADHQHKKHKSDWEIVQSNNEWKIYLRAEKSRHGKEDRIYTIDVTANDFMGNQSQQSIEVIVPHRHKKHSHKNNKKEHKKSESRDKEHRRNKHHDD